MAESEEAGAREAFRLMAGGQAACARAVDAEVTMTIATPWQSGSMAGYLQLMAPGYLKFVGVNPLGQPLLITGTDGETGSYVVPAERKIYQGPLSAEAVLRYLPTGLDPTRSYYWLIGRLRPGQLSIMEVAGDLDRAGLWVEFRYEGEVRRELALFDPLRLLLRRHLLLDEQGEVAFEVEYDSYSTGECPLPGLVTIRGDRRYGHLLLRLDNWLPAETLTGDDFKITVPSDFTRIHIK
ncbi:MAG TPA: hypothetical protein VLA15_03250 [Desulfurivibrionaceae bacterium]|nr:hypothetical protein [Desulfurivibrionaceae bacterium]